MDKRSASESPAIEDARRQRGFTLIELSIILIIVGLLVSSTMAARELMQGARIKALASDFTAIRAAFNAYQDRFHVLPGDDPLAGAHLPGASASPGAGNGIIDGAWNSMSVTDESLLFWQHLRLANLMTGPTDIASADFHPRNPSQGIVGVSSATAAQMQVAGMRGSFQVCSSNIAGKLARQLDIQIDDGDTASGSMRIVADGAPLGSAAIATASVDDGLTYTVCQVF